jgi:hypothetical protein
MNNQDWVLEYSEPSYKQGMYPFHVTTRKDSANRGEGALKWKVVFRGSCEECFAELEKRERRIKYTYAKRKLRT